MSARPRLGLSTSQLTQDLSHEVNGVPRRYAEAVRLAGGLPLLLPNLPELAADYAAQVDAVVLTGGPDLHPRHYGQSPRRGLGEVDEQRDAFETALYRAARALGRPVLGICRGMQTLNVLEGGTLHQHLPDVPGFWADHAQVAQPPGLGHEVCLRPGSLLGRAHGAAAWVNSYHHQAVDAVAPGLTVTATAPDGVIEGLEGDGLLGVQWHPEMLLSRYPEALAPFRVFLEEMVGVRRG
ncbi:gamma-glutamyl-gamma-aminobutyrate hydrolase family protein [Deinococcus sp. SDU3-2]|uniref:Gamma-glutamyl-gamma-aminobutyrate hydrolase family protein n=1 Tax=Deinococcus terrestris TaxID=2651870 RepID=A0A7X1NXK3_9DEIO|nr:gamma-glutamyl-gamma-aminobutyrate hydrolase family protein [Deinococcus terrestris]MPY67672.1 gamma-glutamyl-gamma-aminobutyrate hydrolase family protein [Deinococcus terrestris]